MNKPMMNVTNKKFNEYNYLYQQLPQNKLSKLTIDRTFLHLKSKTH